MDLQNIYEGLIINRRVNGFYQFCFGNTVITAILFNWFRALDHDFHADIFALSKCGVYGYLYIYQLYMATNSLEREKKLNHDYHLLANEPWNVTKRFSRGAP